MAGKNIFSLLQITDSALPIGGFAYSQGMESALKLGLICSHHDCVSYLGTYLQQLISFDLPYANSAFELLHDDHEWEPITSAFEAMTMNPLIQKSSEVMGRNIMRLFSEILSSKSLENCIENFSKKSLPIYLPIAFGLVCASLKIEKGELAQGYLYAGLRDQVSAMTRLGFIGPQGAQALLLKMTVQAQNLLDRHPDIPHYTCATRSAYMIDVAQLHHPYIYSKLFQN